MPLFSLSVFSSFIGRKSFRESSFIGNYKSTGTSFIERYRSIMNSFISPILQGRSAHAIQLSWEHTLYMLVLMLLVGGIEDERGFWPHLKENAKTSLDFSAKDGALYFHPINLTTLFFSNFCSFRTLLFAQKKGFPFVARGGSLLNWIFLTAVFSIVSAALCIINKVGFLKSNDDSLSVIWLGAHFYISMVTLLFLAIFSRYRTSVYLGKALY